MKIIDAHVHPVSRSMVRDTRNLRFMEREGAQLLGESPIQILLNRMDAAGISQACLLGPNPHDGIALTNEAVHDMVASHPNRFIGFVGVDPSGQGKSKTRETIERAVEVWGFKGVGEIGGGDFLAPEWDIVYETCIEKQIPILVHVGIPLPSMLLKYSHPFMLDELAHRYRELTIIAAHVGAPWVIETLATAVRHPNVYLDISALPAIRNELVTLALVLCAERALEDRVLFGSDFPVIDPCKYAKVVTNLTLPAPVRWLGKLPGISLEFKKKVLGENAMKLLRLES